MRIEVYHFVVVRKPDTGPRGRVRGGDREPHVIGLGRVRPHGVVLALAGRHVATLRSGPLAVTVARRRRGHLLFAGRSAVGVVGRAFRRPLSVDRRRSGL